MTSAFLAQAEASGEPMLSPALLAIAEALLAEADRQIAAHAELLAAMEAKAVAAEDDPEADAAAVASAKSLRGELKLRDGHYRAVRAHLRALAKGLGQQHVADYLEALRDMYQAPLDTAQAKTEAEREAAEWEKLRAEAASKIRRPRHSNMRERVEEAIAE